MTYILYDEVHARKKLDQVPKCWVKFVSTIPAQNPAMVPDKDAFQKARFDRYYEIQAKFKDQYNGTFIWDEDTERLTISFEDEQTAILFMMRWS